MKPEEINNRTEVIDLKAGVLFVQTEAGTYCIYCPDKTVIYGKNCLQLADKIFNERVIGELLYYQNVTELSDKVIDNKKVNTFIKAEFKTDVLDVKDDLLHLKSGEIFYVIDAKNCRFYSSSDQEKTLKVINDGFTDDELKLSQSSHPAHKIAHDTFYENQKQVVHCRKEKFDVYIGRPSKWGNPYIIGKDGSREEVINKYEKYLLGNKELMSSLHELKGKTLGCWCDPLPCHGHVIVEMVNRLHLSEKMQDDLGNTLIMHKNNTSQPFSLVDSFGNTRDLPDIYRVMEELEIARRPLVNKIKQVERNEYGFNFEKQQQSLKFSR
jgi:hypothetical protein